MYLKFTFLLVILLLAGYHEGHTQGCVAIRGFSACTGNLGNGAILGKGQWQLGLNHRYFKSFRHFRGDHEEVHRLSEGTEVINHSNFVDLSVLYGVSDRTYLNLILPYVHHTRSSMYEHGGNPPNGLGDRHTTRASGLGDVRLSWGVWLLDPARSTPFNLAVAGGIKFPTGNFKATDTFYNQGQNRDEEITGVVDQSIQPGDGGWGITMDVQMYHQLSHSFMLTGNFYYLSNPMATNGALTRRGTSEFSCADQYAARIGLNYISPVHGLSFYLGPRLEGVPASDLLGSSEGYRRPGYAASVEPGINYSINRLLLSLNVPIAVYRNRTQSYSDKQRTIETGVYRHGDAAFANFLFNFNVSYILGKGNHNMAPSDLIEIH